jgi:hypothetical protein
MLPSTCRERPAPLSPDDRQGDTRTWRVSMVVLQRLERLRQYPDEAIVRRHEIALLISRRARQP